MTVADPAVADLLALLSATLKAGDMQGAATVIQAIAGIDPKLAESIVALVGVVNRIKAEETA